MLGKIIDCSIARLQMFVVTDQGAVLYRHLYRGALDVGRWHILFKSGFADIDVNAVGQGSKNNTLVNSGEINTASVFLRVGNFVQNLAHNVCFGPTRF